ncbi:hypothetical protein L484_007845 [Morus notabilis]|uniref:Uncharacterized protein n=1 Tax=Morus notabilis TaxID=981085 RepID=W9RSC2_9ROSA|nr:hypothetical protein L484_007845 [Morus notabilis]
MVLQGEDGTGNILWPSPYLVAIVYKCLARDKGTIGLLSPSLPLLNRPRPPTYLAVSNNGGAATLYQIAPTCLINPLIRPPLAMFVRLSTEAELEESAIMSGEPGGRGEVSGFVVAVGAVVCD